MLIKGLFLFSIFIDTIFPRGRNGVLGSTSSIRLILAVLLEDIKGNIVLKFESN